MEFVYVRDPLPLGTAGALRQVLDRSEANLFLVMNGDSYCRFDLDCLLEFHNTHKAHAHYMVDCSN